MIKKKYAVPSPFLWLGRGWSLCRTLFPRLGSLKNLAWAWPMGQVSVVWTLMVGVAASLAGFAIDYSKIKPYPRPSRYDLMKL
ncbi:MAG: hypothetical protein CFE21_17555 [Bacteroidetes bacterium B1(2017)]|nr:MAG: hypothetical protein CFE21_17555 [Bacteroidetes bacterium B1(2017)]